MELDGPARQRALARVVAEAKLSCPGAPCAEDPAEDLLSLRDTAPRLFAVDAGLDAAALRRRYPDRARYAIAAGEVDLELAPAEDGRPAHLGGSVQKLEISELHVPFSFRRPYDALIAEMHRQSAPSSDRPPPPPPFRATVAWGERQEPWLVDLTPLSPAPSPPPAR